MKLENVLVVVGDHHKASANRGDLQLNLLVSGWLVSAQVVQQELLESLLTALHLINYARLTDILMAGDLSPFF